MDYTQLLNELEQASLFDLYRLNTGIRKMLDQPERINAIKRRLKPGMDISYFDQKENRLIPAIVEAIHRTRLGIRNKEDGERWDIRYYTVNVESVDTDIHCPQGKTEQNKLDRNTLKVGDLVGFHDKEQQEQYGEIVRLNPKTVTLFTKSGTKWRVPYSFLFKVIEGKGFHSPGMRVIEGEVITKQTIGDEHETEYQNFNLFDSDTVETTTVTNPVFGQKIGRNTLCPCGSGKKFKKCCIDSTEK